MRWNTHLTGTPLETRDNTATGDGGGVFPLQSAGPRFDRCAGGDAVDLDDDPRPTSYVRPTTLWDMGADEQLLCQPFCDGFESADTSAWSAAAP